METAPSLPAILLGLSAGAAGVVYAGVLLARSADVIATRTGLGGLWLGMVLLAFATSLPELVTAGTAAWIGAPDLAAGDLFGSNMANMLILAVLNLLPGAEVFRRASLDQALSATFAISLTAIAGGFVLLATPLSVGIFGPGSLLLLGVYLVGSRAILRHTSAAEAARGASSPPDVAAEPALSMRKAAWTFLLGTVLVTVTAPIFAVSAEGAVELTGLTESFVGVIVLGVATSLPEVVTSLAALRIGAYDLAVGNLFGSNAINMVMFAPLDLVTSSPILAAVDPVHAFAGLASIVMMALALGAIALRSRGKLSLLEPSSGLIILTYIVSVAMVMGWGG